MAEMKVEFSRVNLIKYFKKINIFFKKIRYLIK